MSFKKFEDLTFTDDYMFWTVMTNYEEICTQVAALCLGQKVRKIRYKEGQRTLQMMPDSKGIRLDVYLEDEEDTVYDFEMQNVPKPFLGRRIRYYGSTMDIHNLSKGMDYEQLPDAYIVFLCMFDPFGAGRVVYEFERREKVRTDLRLNDGSTVILINPYGGDSGCTPELKTFLSYLRGETDAASAGIGAKIDAAICQIKNHEKWRTGYMKYEADMMDYRREGYKDGKAEGREEGRAERDQEIIDNLTRMGMDEAFIKNALRISDVPGTYEEKENLPE